MLNPDRMKSIRDYNRNSLALESDSPKTIPTSLVNGPVRLGLGKAFASVLKRIIVTHSHDPKA